MILDTSFLVDVIRGHPAALKLMREIEGGSEAVRIPTAVAFELWEGAERSKRPAAEMRLVGEALAAYPAVPLLEAHAKRAGLVSASLMDRGEPVSDVDLLIGGTAVAEGEVLVTRNKRDFERVPGLRLRTY